MATMTRARAYEGPVILSYGFRPFFLMGSLCAGIAILVWLPMFFGEIALPTAFVPRDWHVHEMLYGYLPAVVAGFLLTAVPNWTGRLPIRGRPLLGLAVVWMAGRLAVATSAWIGWAAAAGIDAAFLLLLAATAGREIVAAKNWRNLKVVAVLGVLFVANLVFHVEAHVDGLAVYGLRLGIAAMLLLVMLIGGRIVPAFTRNWLMRAGPGRMPADFDRFDTAAMIWSAAALLAWIAAPDWAGTGVGLIVAGLLQAGRLARWAGERIWRDRLVLVLHVAFAFVPLGFVLVGLSALGLVPAGAGIHAWMVGAVGGMTLAVMSRASLGHTGRALAATRPTKVVFALVFVAALARICAVLEPQHSIVLLHLAGAAWVAAFLGFAVAYWRVFTGPRLGI